MLMGGQGLVMRLNINQAHYRIPTKEVCRVGELCMLVERSQEVFPNPHCYYHQDPG